AGDGPFPVITMGRGDGKGGVPHLEAQVDLLASMQDEMIKRGYVVVYVNYRNEVPHLYETIARAENLPDDISGGVRRTVKSSPTLDSDDLMAIFKYLRSLPYVDPEAIGAIGVSHSGEMILKVAAEMDFAAGVAIEGASHEFISVDTGPSAGLQARTMLSGEATRFAAASIAAVMLSVVLGLMSKMRMMFAG
ncbi:MAG: hypothetical protein EBU47_13100, partial [Betaproteobacteria bacterium]|nr:hypothetical protein [Betaproteobacteria bacterium]